jgi:malate dehydrogenase (oxaloacetate-decarboxylating)(NADP+)
MNKAKSTIQKKRIVFAEGEEPKIIRAAAQIKDDGIGIPILVGRPEEVKKKMQILGLENDLEITYPSRFPKNRSICRNISPTPQAEGGRVV